jgi:hypothetical protein
MKLIMLIALTGLALAVQNPTQALAQEAPKNTAEVVEADEDSAEVVAAETQIPAESTTATA